MFGVVESEFHEALEGDGAAIHLGDDGFDETRVAEGRGARVEVEGHCDEYTEGRGIGPSCTRAAPLPLGRGTEARR